MLRISCLMSSIWPRTKVWHERLCCRYLISNFKPKIVLAAGFGCLFFNFQFQLIFWELSQFYIDFWFFPLFYMTWFKIKEIKFVKLFKSIWVPQPYFFRRREAFRSLRTEKNVLVHEWYLDLWTSLLSSAWFVITIW